jgi:two-component system, sensor histidine kinase YesM
MKLRRKSKSIQSTLFITYFYILFAVLISFMTFYIISESNKIKNNAFSLMTQNVNTISSYVDEEAKTLNTVAQNIAYSNLIKERFTYYINAAAESTSSTDQDIAYNNVQNTKSLIDMLTAILGPNQPVVQIYLYSLDKGVFGVGLDTSTSKNSAKDYAWYPPFMASEHYKYLTSDKDERLENFYSYKSGATFISLYMMYYNSYNVPQGIIEVKNSISFLTPKIKNIIKSYDEKIFVFDRDGKSIYPNFSVSEYNEYFSSISSKEKLVNSDKVATYRYDKNTYMFFKTSEDTGFTVAIAVKESSLLQPIYEYIKVNAIALVIIAFAMLLLSYIAAHIITTPITKIYRQVQSFKLDLNNNNKNIFTDIDTPIIEFNTLYSALITMQKKAQKSMEREINLQNQEMQSRMLALQSQMNPHFLYNSLATIQSMADEQMYDEIHLMCQNISSILRYISSDKELLVPLNIEMKNTIDYLLCMKIRYDDDLIYEIIIPDEMRDLKIPKLCIQQLVENSIKFTTKSIKPPWKIVIQGTITNTYWELAISDNGTGFGQKEIDDLNEKIEEINRTGLLPNLEIRGMGLMNIYIRFKLLYKGSHIFRISNLAQGGALVTIGGKIDES